MQNRGIRMSPVSKFAHGIDCITQHVVFLMGYPFEHLFGSTKIGLSAPHLCVSSCFWLRTPVRIRSSSSSRLLLLPPPPSHTTLANTTCLHTSLSHTTYSHTHNSLINNSLINNSLTQLAYTELSHTQLTHTHNLLTHNSLTHNLLTHNSLKHTQLAHTHTQLSHITHSQITLSCRRGSLCGKRGTWRHRPSFCVASVAIESIHLHSVWQAWHFATSTFTLWQAQDF